MLSPKRPLKLLFTLATALLPDILRLAGQQKVANVAAESNGGELMAIPGVTVVCLENPAKYSQAQVDEACRIAFMLQIRNLVLCMPPQDGRDD